MKDSILGGELATTGPQMKWQMYKEKNWDRVPHTGGAEPVEGVFTGQMANSIKVDFTELVDGTDIAIGAVKEIHWRNLMKPGPKSRIQPIRGAGEIIEHTGQDDRTNDPLYELDWQYMRRTALQHLADVRAASGQPFEKAPPVLVAWYNAMNVPRWSSVLFNSVYWPWSQETRKAIKSALSA
jgi:hypothetical protein